MKQDRYETAAEVSFYAQRSIPKLHKSSFALEPVMFKSALFRPGTGQRAVFDTYTALPSHGGQVEFQGEELRQDDERVLMALLKLRSGEVVTDVLKLTPRTFCRDIGWADSSDSTAKLQACLERLQKARIRVKYADGGLSLYSLVSDAHMVGGDWVVWLSPRLVQMFERSVTYINMDARLGMKDGFESWLYGFIKADMCAAPFELDSLRQMSLDGYAPNDFVKQVKKSLESMKGAGLITTYAVNKGRLTVKK